MLDVGGVSFFERQQFRPTVIDRQHERGKGAFHRGMLVKIVDDDLRIRVALEFDYHSGVFIRLVSDRGDVSENFFIYEFSDSLHQGRAIHAIRNLGDDDLLFAALDFFDAGFAAHFHATAAASQVLFYAGKAANRATGREIRSFHELHQPFEVDVRIVDLRANSIDDFSEIVRRDVGRHADGDAGASVN